MRSYSIALATFVAVVCPLSDLAAQPKKSRARAARSERKSLSAEVTRLQRAISELASKQVDTSSILTTLQELQRQLIALRGQARADRKVRRGYQALRAQLDEIDQRLGDLQLRLTALAVRDNEIARVEYDRGFVFEKGRFRLRVRGLVQAEYQARVLSKERDLAGGQGHDQSTFAVGRARLALAGHVASKRLTYQLAFELGDRARPNVLLDAYLAYRFHRALQVTAGLMRVPFGRQYALDLDGMLFGDRGPVTESFYPGRDLGLLVSGALFDSPRFGVFSYQIGAFNGAGQSLTRDNNLDLLYAARLLYEPFGRLPTREADTDRSRRPLIALGGSFTYNLAPTDAAARLSIRDPARLAQVVDQDGDGEVDNIAIYSAAAELALHWRGVALSGELFYRHEDPGAVSATRSFWGTHVQLSASHRAGLELGVRYSFWESNRFGEDGATLAAARTHEAAVVLAAWLLQRSVRVQTAYAHRWLRDISDRQGNIAGDPRLRAHVVLVQTQLVF